MKKAITILAVLIVLVGAVFAEIQTENHSIKLHTTVDPVVPVFHLNFKDVTATAAAGAALAADDAQSTNGGNTAFANNGAHTYTAESRAALEVGDISKGAITVNFDVTISNAAKIYRSYDLTFGATGFAVTKNNSPVTTAAPTPTLAGFGDHTGVSVSQKTQNVAATAAFNGTTCEADTVLATYKLVYAQDPAVDPTNAGATYTADVTLTITTTV